MRLQEMRLDEREFRVEYPLEMGDAFGEAVGGEG